MRDKSPFVLGLPNERWEDKLPGLVIPIPGIVEIRHVIVMRTHDKSFRVFMKDDDVICEDLIMAASKVHHFIDSYHER